METTQQENNNDGKNVENIIGIIAYITLIGWIIALIMNNDKKGSTKSFGAFHLRQSIGLMIIGFIGSFIVGIIPFLNLLLIPVFSIAIFILIIIGIINAANTKKKPLPIVGDFIEKTFKQAFE